MRVLIAPDSFRGGLSGHEVAAALETGLSRAVPNAEFVMRPVADGGEGTVDLLIECLGGRSQTQIVTGLLGGPINATWGILGDDVTAVIEISAASGVDTVEASRRDPMRGTSAGTGELVRAALDQGCRRILLGLGGSGTIDGGLGLLSALGVRFLDADGRSVAACGAGLAHLAAIDASAADARLAEVDFTVLCDIDTPMFFDDTSIARMFGPQKGASPENLKSLDSGLRNLAAAVCEQTGVQIGDAPYDGASGAVAGTLRGLLDVRLVSGVDALLEMIRFDALLAQVDLVITGEGRIDRQTLRGKALLGVVRAARRADKPVACVAGQVADDITPSQLGCVSPIFETLTSSTVMPGAEMAKRQLAEVGKHLGELLAATGIEGLRHVR